MSKRINKVADKNGKVLIDLPYSKYIYLKGNFKESISCIYKLKKGEKIDGKTYKKWDLVQYNCAFMALEVMHRGLVGDKYKAKRKAIKEIQYHPSIRRDGYYTNTVVPADAFRKIAALWGVKPKNIK